MNAITEIESVRFFMFLSTTTHFRQLIYYYYLLNISFLRKKPWAIELFSLLIMNKKKCTKTISLRHVVSLISFWQQTTSLICRVRTVCIWVISIVFCSVCVCVFIWRRKMKCLRLEKAAHSICSTFVYNTNYYYSAFHIIVFIIVNSIIMWMSLECLSDIHMLNIQRAKIISRSSSSSFSQMWQFFQRAGKRVQLQTLLFSVPYTHPKNKFNANNVNNLCGCVWCVGKFIAEQDVEKERERRKSGKSFKNIISWLLLFRVKTISSLILHCLVSWMPEKIWMRIFFLHIFCWILLRRRRQASEKKMKRMERKNLNLIQFAQPHVCSWNPQGTIYLQQL